MWLTVKTCIEPLTNLKQKKSVSNRRPSLLSVKIICLCMPYPLVFSIRHFMFRVSNFAPPELTRNGDISLHTFDWYTLISRNFREKFWQWSSSSLWEPALYASVIKFGIPAGNSHAHVDLQIKYVEDRLAQAKMHSKFWGEWWILWVLVVASFEATCF